MTTTLGPIVLRYVGDRRRRAEICPLTARNLRNHLTSFADSFGRRPLGQLGLRAVERWQESHAHLSPATRALRLSSLRCFAEWCVLHRVVDRDWTIGVPKVRRPRSQPRDLSVGDVAALLGVARTARERAILWLAFAGGLRCVEIHRLDVDDVDFAAQVVFVTGKAGHQRFVPVPGPMLAAVSGYLTAAGHSSGALIRAETGDAGRLGPERISGLVGRMIRDAGLKIRRYDGRSAHALRALAASEVYDASHDPQVVQEFLGHAGLGNLHVYLRRAQLERVREAQDARRWAA